MKDFRLPWRCKWGRRSSGILHSVDSWLRTDVSGQPIGLVFNSQAVQEEFRELLGTQLYREWFGHITFRT